MSVPKIKLLPESVANQIAAGEVVDRPASVVKELVENALDAAATRVRVEVEQGGKREIKVADDGEGMTREDALLCLERHATSKISAARDLFAIHTLGFRGEALPSIASVSEMTIITRTREELAGTKVEVKAGEIKKVTDIGAAPGTEITVRRLFFNVPARRKFLKTVDTELSHITALIANMALARPDVHFTLLHNGKTIFDLPSSPDLSGRLRHALGADPLSKLIPLDFESADLLPSGLLRVHGYISLPSYTRASTRSLHVFINRRFVRDRLINHAVFEAYRGLLPKGRYPLVVLFLDLPAEEVDVNVHPAKHEVRFRSQAQVHEFVCTAIKKVLQETDRAGARVLPELEQEPTPLRFEGEAKAETQTPPERGEQEQTRLRERVAMAVADYYESRERTGRGFRDSVSGGRGIRSPFPNRGREGAPPGPEPSGPEKQAASPAPPEPSSPLPGIDFSQVKVIGQAAGSFILAETDDSLLIIDQHAAHERIAFEQLKREFTSDSPAMQPLLFPLTVELSREEAAAVEKAKETLLRLGFEVEPFGGGTIAVKSLPALLAGADPEKLLLEVADQLMEAEKATAVEERIDHIIAVMACHSVVRAGESMSEEEMKDLVKALARAEWPGHCPHGREAVARIPFKDLEKWFRR